LGVDRLKEGRCMNPQLAEQEVREELVSRIRQEIEDGVYDTPERFDAALDRLADRLESD
jgi:anti-sigma28 factor (negative regulator of flagellin synthesis)